MNCDLPNGYIPLGTCASPQTDRPSTNVARLRLEEKKGSKREGEAHHASCVTFCHYGGKTARGILYVGAIIKDRTSHVILAFSFIARNWRRPATTTTT